MTHPAIDRQRPATPAARPAPSVGQEPWRALRSSLAVRFVSRDGSELEPQSVGAPAKAGLLAGLEARQSIVKSYSRLEPKVLAKMPRSRRDAIKLIVHGFLEVRERGSGEFDFVFSLYRRRSSWTAGQLGIESLALERMVQPGR